MYESNYCTLKNRGNVLTKNAIFDHFAEQIGGIGQKLVLAHALTCAYPSKVLAPMIGANTPVEMGSSTAVDYPPAKWFSKAGTENHQLFSEQTYHYTSSSTEQTWCNTATYSSHCTAHEDVPQYQRNEHRLDPGLVPEGVRASDSIAGYMPARENLLPGGSLPIMRPNRIQHTKIQTAWMRILTPRSCIKQNSVPVEASRLGSSRPGSKGVRFHRSYVQLPIRGSQIAHQDLSVSSRDSNLHYRKSEKFSPRVDQLKQGSSNYTKPPVNHDETISVSPDLYSSQRKIFLPKTEKLDKLNNDLPSGHNCRRNFKQSLNGFFCCKCGNIKKMDGEHRKRDYCSHQKCSRSQEFDKAQPTSEAAMVTIPSFYSKREWRHNTERWAIVSAFCHSIEQMCRANNQKITTKIAQPQTRFHAAATPDISVSDFVKRIGWFCDFPKECFVIALEYIHRTVKHKPEIQVNFNSAHHLILTCLQVSVKFYDDAVLNQKYYSQVVGLPAVNISTLEKELLFLLSFDLFVLPGRYQQILIQMLNDNKGLYKVDLRPELDQ